MNEAIDHRCNWNDVYVPYKELETMLNRESSSAVAIYCFGSVKAELMSSFLILTVIDITQLGCPLIADINRSAISCTFACHNKSKHSSEISTSCNNCVFILRKGFTLHVSGDNIPIIRSTYADNG